MENMHKKTATLNENSIRIENFILKTKPLLTTIFFDLKKVLIKILKCYAR